MVEIRHDANDCPDPVNVVVRVGGHSLVAQNFCPGHDPNRRWTLEELWAIAKEQSSAEWTEVQLFLEYLGG